jgi:D-beta-D-heptose 7-phosphate kinase/D-beta-D-heptose 1-phosphate adenosyltransferase
MSGNNIKKKKVIVAVSGGFDPIHIGHIELFEEAKKLGDELVVILNNDNWIRAKKRHIFMPEQERRAIIEALRVVDRVVLTKHEPSPSDMSVCRELKELQPHIFAQGGDRNKEDGLNPTSSQSPEVKLCAALGIPIAYGVGPSGKIQSSSWLLSNYIEKVSKREEA